MGTEENSNSLGAWVGSDLEATARANAGLGSDAGLPVEVRFVTGVAKLIRRRMAQGESKSDPNRPAVFLLRPEQSSRPTEGYHRVPMLDNGLTQMCGRLWFVSASPASGNYLDLEEALQDEEIFELVSDKLQLGGVSAAIYDPRVPVPALRFYPSGINEPDNYELLELTATEITLERICEVISRVHGTCLVTPDIQSKAGKLWKNEDKWHPVGNAEDLVQMQVRAGLAVAFTSCNIRQEQPSAPGRLDLAIEEPSFIRTGQITVHAILELKVLRSYWSSGASLSAQETLDWIEEGVRQASSYRDDRNARLAALCCFDMRKDHTGEECFAHVRALAASLAVVLRVWYLFASSQLYRQFLTKDKTVGVERSS